MFVRMEKTQEIFKSLENYVPFWTEVKEVWNHGLFGIDIGSIIIAIGIFIAFLVLRGFIARFILARLVNWSEQSATKLDDAILPCLIPPLKFIPVILGVFCAGQYLELSNGPYEFFGRLIRSMIAFTIFWAIYLASGKKHCRCWCR